MMSFSPCFSSIRRYSSRRLGYCSALYTDDPQPPSAADVLSGVGGTRPYAVSEVVAAGEGLVVTFSYGLEPATTYDAWCVGEDNAAVPVSLSMLHGGGAGEGASMGAGASGRAAARELGNAGDSSTYAGQFTTASCAAGDAGAQPLTALSRLRDIGELGLYTRRGATTADLFNLPGEPVLLRSPEYFGFLPDMPAEERAGLAQEMQYAEVHMWLARVDHEHSDALGHLADAVSREGWQSAHAWHSTAKMITECGCGPGCTAWYGPCACYDRNESRFDAAIEAIKQKLQEMH